MLIYNIVNMKQYIYICIFPGLAAVFALPFFGVQVVREATTTVTSDTGVVASYSTAERGMEMQEALRCLVLLTAHRHRALYRTLGLSATSPSTPAGVEALLDLAAVDGGAALQVTPVAVFVYCYVAAFVICTRRKRSADVFAGLSVSPIDRLLSSLRSFGVCCQLDRVKVGLVEDTPEFAHISCCFLP